MISHTDAPCSHYIFQRNGIIFFLHHADWYKPNLPYASSLEIAISHLATFNNIASCTVDLQYVSPTTVADYYTFACLFNNSTACNAKLLLADHPIIRKENGNKVLSPITYLQDGTASLRKGKTPLDIAQRSATLNHQLSIRSISPSTSEKRQMRRDIHGIRNRIFPIAFSVMVHPVPHTSIPHELYYDQSDLLPELRFYNILVGQILIKIGISSFSKGEFKPIARPAKGQGTTYSIQSIELFVPCMVFCHPSPVYNAVINAILTPSQNQILHSSTARDIEKSEILLAEVSNKIDTCQEDISQGIQNPLRIPEVQEAFAIAPALVSPNRLLLKTYIEYIFKCKLDDLLFKDYIKYLNILIIILEPSHTCLFASAKELLSDARESEISSQITKFKYFTKLTNLDEREICNLHETSLKVSKFTGYPTAGLIRFIRGLLAQLI